MNAAIEEEDASTSGEVCTVVVLYEDDVTRARALAAGDYLVRQFWEEVELKFHWWRTDFLQDACLAEMAAHDAIESDLLIVCFQDPVEISPQLEAWYERWIDRRKNRPGALVDLCPKLVTGDQRDRRQDILREIARRGMFDYLVAVPESAESNPRRPSHPPAAGRSEWIGEMRDDSRPPSHYGLNE
jgi:hypothetical protein